MVAGVKMNASDKPEFARIIAALSAVKPGKELTRDALELYFSALEDWTIADFKAAASHLMKTCEFMPNPFHFEQLRKKNELTKHEAWEVAFERIKRGGNQPDDKISKAIRQVGGYYQLGMTPMDQMPFVAKRFQEAYESINDVESVPLLTKPEASNVMRRLLK
jgi:hypothetical protein